MKILQHASLPCPLLAFVWTAALILVVYPQTVYSWTTVPFLTSSRSSARSQSQGCHTPPNLSVAIMDSSCGSSMQWKHVEQLDGMSSLPPMGFWSSHQRPSPLGATSAWNPNRPAHPVAQPRSFENSFDDCIFMPFWEWQLSKMQQDLDQFKILDKFHKMSSSGKHRMITITAQSKDYRYIRITYVDGGDKLQVFTTVCYPRGNHPLFGMDLLRFQNGKRHLAVCDFQPIHINGSENDHDIPYEQSLQAIRQHVPQLQEKMSGRYFSPSKYFSNQTILSRFANQPNEKGLVDPSISIWKDLWPTYQAYFQTHLQMVNQQQASNSLSKLTPEQVLEQHKAYDNYMAQCDPAHSMFASIFGKEFADQYLYDILFPLADKPKKDNMI